MISKNLSNNEKKIKILKENLNQYHWLGLMSFVLISYVTTIPALISLLDAAQSGRFPSGKYYFIHNDWLMRSTYLIALIMGISLFKYLNHKSEVDFFHSLPIKSEEMFLSRYLYGILCFLIPSVFHFILTYGIVIFGQFHYVPTISEISVAWLETFLSYVSCYTFACLGAILTGNIFMGVCSACGIMVAPSALAYVGSALCEVFYHTYAGDYIYTSKIIMYTNPFATSYLWYESTDNKIYLFLQILVVLPITYYFYTKRPSENSGIPVAVEPFPLIIKSLGVVCGSSLCGILFLISIGETIVNFLIGSFCMAIFLHIAFEILLEMDIRAAFRNKKHFYILYSIVAVTGIVVSLDLTGYDKRIEPVEKISQIQWNGKTLESSENIEIIHTLMGEAIDSGKVSRTKVNDISYVTVDLKNGSSYQRKYTNLNFSNEEYLSVILSEEYFTQSHNYNLTEENFQQLLESTEGDVAYIYADNIKISVNKEEFQHLFQLILEDNHLLTKEYIRENAPILSIGCRDIFYNSYSIPIYNIHEKVLAELNLREPTVEINEYSHLYGKEGSVPFSNLNLEQQSAFLEEMEVIYNGNGGYYSDIFAVEYKEMVSLISYSEIVGYLSYEDYDALMEKYK